MTMDKFLLLNITELARKEAYVTDRMLSHNPFYTNTKKWNGDSAVASFSLLLSSSATLDRAKHIDLYTHKGLLHQLEGITQLTEWMRQDVKKI
jgi:endonuclease IV